MAALSLDGSGRRLRPTLRYRPPCPRSIQNRPKTLYTLPTLQKIVCAALVLPSNFSVLPNDSVRISGRFFQTSGMPNRLSQPPELEGLSCEDAILRTTEHCFCVQEKLFWGVAPSAIFAADLAAPAAAAVTDICDNEFAELQTNKVAYRHRGGFFSSHLCTHSLPGGSNLYRA